jgi:AAA+ superfamily predicted ATPase
MLTKDFVGEALQKPQTALLYAASARLAELFPQKAILETDTWQFRLQAFAAAGECQLTLKGTVHNQVFSYWNKEYQRIYRQAVQAWLEVEWQGHRLDVLMLKIGCNDHYWLLADVKEVVESFFAAVCEWELEIRSEVLVFDGDHWYKDEELFAAIQNATFDNLVLQGSLARDLLADVRRFFSAQATYQTYGIPWKRGILLVGPPGNGKTHAVKALINSLDIPCLYVKSFKGRYNNSEGNMQVVFERARESAPCLLVLEDLDAQITAENRSFFLNELDGFATNTGILTLATTNHPDRLDPAIVNRPSRFDRKYHFDLPGVLERQGYIAMWNQSLQPALQLSAGGVEKVAGLSEAFSFAYLKELFVSALMGWINQEASEGSGKTMDEVMLAQVALLREQMVSLSIVAPSGASEGTEEAA